MTPKEWDLTIEEFRARVESLERFFKDIEAVLEVHRYRAEALEFAQNNLKRMEKGNK